MKLDTKAFEAKMQKLVTGYEAELETIVEEIINHF